MRNLSLLVLLLPAMLSLAARAEPLTYAAGTRCACPAEIARLGEPLRNVAERLERHLAVKVVAIGSSSTQGYGASLPENAYPARLEQHLRRRLPGIPVSVINRGVGGEEAPQMLARFDDQVLSEHPDLVVWQVGSNGAMRGRSIDELDDAVAAGIARLRDADIDVIVMNAQYAPRILAVPKLSDYLNALTTQTRNGRAALLDRFDIMRHWVSSGAMTVDEPLIADGLHQSDLGYDCLARVLADAIVEAADGPPAPQQAGAAPAVPAETVR